MKIIGVKKNYANDINFNLLINGEEMQLGYTGFMIYIFIEIIALVSSYITLEFGVLALNANPVTSSGNNIIGNHLKAFIED